MRRNAGFIGKSNDETCENLFRNLGATQAAADFQRAEWIFDHYELVKEDAA